MGNPLVSDSQLRIACKVVLRRGLEGLAESPDGEVVPVCDLCAKDASCEGVEVGPRFDTFVIFARVVELGCD